MSKTRNLSDLLDANGDVKSTALDNVPAADVVNDTTPQLGGNLDLNSNDITGTGNINITGNATISGDIAVDTSTFKLDSANNRVGIGNSSPISPLTVGGIQETGTNRASIAVKTISNSLAIGESAIQIEEQSGTEGYFMGVDSTGGLFFSNSGSATKALYLGDDDNITASGTVTANAFSGDGSGLTNVPAGVSSVKTLFYTSSTTYTPTSGTKFVTVYCNGAGGGGGNRSGSTISGSKGQQGGGGGAGGMAIRTFNATELGSSASITIGSGGSGGASHHDPRHGSTGGNTTFNPAGTGNTLTGNGGTGGKGNNGTWHGLSGEGGTASGGTINIVGQSGYQNTLISSSNSTARNDSGDGVFGGNGGRTMWTGGGLNKAVGTGEVETSGANGANGCGGQGASARAGYQAGGSGGSGGSGYVLIMEYA